MAAGSLADPAVPTGRRSGMTTAGIFTGGRGLVWWMPSTGQQALAKPVSVWSGCDDDMVFVRTNDAQLRFPDSP